MMQRRHVWVSGKSAGVQTHHISDLYLLLTGSRTLASSCNLEASISSIIRTVAWPAKVYMRSEDLVFVQRSERCQAK